MRSTSLNRLNRWAVLMIFLITLFTFSYLNTSREKAEHVRKTRIAGILQQIAKDSSMYVEKSAADEIYKNVTVLCYILTMEANLDNKVAVVNTTWARRCNRVLYILCTGRNGPDILSTCAIGESKEHLTGKVRYSIKHIYQHYLNQYDWFLKADDDTFVVMENLRYLLSHYPTDKAGYLGYHFKLFVNQGYMSGGAGYVINRQALKQIVEWGFGGNYCREDGGDEDVEIGRCLEASGVSVFSSLDKFDRETFHTDSPWKHALGLQPEYLDEYSNNGVKTGADCCSQYPVTYHHMDEEHMLFLEHMLYRTHVWGRHGKSDMKDLFRPKEVHPREKETIYTNKP
ncbi:glycoprotein-N-acetylgalactosamine 3-beta-galactosyltransferase 1-like isoform X2 [Argopecten irradians]|uniref:glycoprotein-N-acetylgalactosamine 3-beta-galactosyltransferase 1-like isoform X2 n=1 Tax=Argopecten irradians TaxID=31199 RepID=UPI0037111549